MGGSEIAVSPSTSFYTGLDYMVFFDELDDENKVIGFDYYATLLSQIAGERLQTIRDIAKNITDVSDFAQDNAIYDPSQDAVSDYNTIQHLIFNVALLITAVMFIMIYIRFIKKS